MKVKDLIEKLKTCDQNSEVTISDYFGCNHTVVSIDKIIQCHKGNLLSTYKTHADDGGKFVDKCGKIQKDIIYLTYK